MSEGVRRVRGARAFAAQFASAPAPHFIEVGDPVPHECPGTAANPQAQAGHLCVYEGSGSNRFAVTIMSPATFGPTAASRWGAIAVLSSSASGRVYSVGTWAATSP